MAYLNPLELERLKLLLSGKTLTTAEQLSALDILRSRFPDFLSNPIFNLTKEDLKDNNFLIKYLTNPYNRNKIKNALRNELSLSPAQQIDLEQALSEKPVAAEEVSQSPVAGEASAGQAAPAGTIAGAPPLGGMPSAPSISSPVPRRIFITEQTTPPSAGKAGGTGQGTAATNKAAGLIAKEEVPSAFQKAFENEPEHTLDPTKQPPSPSAPSGKGPSAPKFQAPRVPYSFTNATKNFGSSASIFTKKAGNRLMGGLSNILGGAGRAGGGLLGGGGRALGNLGLKAVDVAANLSHQVSRGSLIRGPAKGIGKKVALGLIGFLILTGVIGAIAIQTQTQQPTSPSPTTPTTTIAGLDYYIPFRDSSIRPLDIKSEVKAAFSGAKLEYWEEPIIRRSVEAGWNPAFVLALWIEETGASHTTLEKNGGSEMPVSGNLSKGHLGCAPSQDQTINESLDCLFKGFSQYQDDQFSNFMAHYSGGSSDAPFSNNPNFPANIKQWYSKLVPTGAGALLPITYNIPSGPADFIYYCQGNTSWQTTCSLGSSGCGPSSLAIVLSTFKASCNGRMCTPVEVDTVFRTNGWRSCGGPSSMVTVLHSQWIKDLGFEVGPNLVNGSSFDTVEASKYLDPKRGYLIIGSSNLYPCANCKVVGSLVDHIFVIDSVDPFLGTVDIRDPNNCSYANGNDENQANRVKKANSFPWLYAYPIKKVR